MITIVFLLTIQHVCFRSSTRNSMKRRTTCLPLFDELIRNRAYICIDTAPHTSGSVQILLSARNVMVLKE